jgi:GH15 family glucan-1,4-alpha-glucosidase
VTWALRRHFLVFRDVEFVRDLYNPLVIDAAEWMLEFRDPSGLPKPSWDLWEERRGVHLFTVCATIGALRAAHDFARDMGALDRAEEFRAGAEGMTRAMMRVMWDEGRGRFARMATPLGDGSYRLDFTLDASAFALFAFGALDARDERVDRHMRALGERLWVQTPIGGMARYEHDHYHAVERNDITRVPGNPWVICTLWYAQWLVERARTIEELQEALPLLEWTHQRALPSGVLAEQFDPYTGAQVSVSPLTWSHATYMIVVAKYLRRHGEITGVPHGVPTGD